MPACTGIRAMIIRSRPLLPMTTNLSMAGISFRTSRRS
nr:MAG TPA: hypothetical protein [Caudoviricetes sp.]